MIEVLFSLVFLGAAPFWGLMILAPRWSVTRRVIGSPWIVLGPVLIYAVTVSTAFGDVLAALTAPTLDGVRELLGSPVGATAGWAHFVAFDLFVGRWIYLDSRDRGVPALITAPVLFLNIMLGPLAVLVHLLIRLRWSVDHEGLGDHVR